MRGKWMVNIVEQGDTLNEDSANCILKLLEEPPPYLVNILLYRNAANMLAHYSVALSDGAVRAGGCG